VLIGVLSKYKLHSNINSGLRRHVNEKDNLDGVSSLCGDYLLYVRFLGETYQYTE